MSWPIIKLVNGSPRGEKIGHNEKIYNAHKIIN